MQERASLVIIGAGIVGCSTAYHLVQKGWRDIVVLEQGPLFATGGSTSHAPGLVFQTNSSKTMTNLASYTVKLLSGLELNGEPCWHPVGSLEVAQTKERWEELKHRLGFAISWGLQADLLTPHEAQRKVPLLDPSKIYGALHVPSDGLAKAVRAAEAMANVSKEHGATFYGKTPVTDIEVANGRVQAVMTPQGRIATELVLVCTGIWGPRIGRMVGVPIPLIPVEHQFVRTTPLAELAGETREIVHPLLRHQDKSLYFRQHFDQYGIGSYQHEPLLVEVDRIQSHREARVMPSVRDFTPEHFAKPWSDSVELLPELRNADLTYKINGMFSFTPDGQPLLGESPDVRGFWVAEAVWVTHAGGVGKVMAEWLADGTSSIDLRECDLNRFDSYAHSPAYIKARGAQQYREIYDIIHPLQQMDEPRPLRISPFYQRQKDLGAVFFEGRGWERPQWFAANEALVADYPVPSRSGWTARFWSPVVGAEHQATRERVAMFDMSPLFRIEVSGPGALAFLEKLTTNRIDKPVGRIIYTAILDQKGGVKTDLTITRLSETHFQLGCNGPQDLALLRLLQPTDGSVQVQDVTSRSCGIGVWGPRARDLVQQLSEDDFSGEAFPFFTSRQVFIREVPVTALRLSFVGELGWELYTPTEYGLRLWDLLWEAGQSLGVIAAGRGAFDSLRLEKGFRVWGNDVNTEHNPYEAGIDFAVKLDKGDFIGREALARISEQGISHRLCCLTLDHPNQIVMGKEPILDGDRVLGYVTSAAYGYTVGSSIAYGYLSQAYAAEGTKVDIEFFGNRYQATVMREPLYDPKNARLLS